MAKAEGARKQHVDEVTEVREDLTRAEAAHAREAARVTDAQRELERLADELRDTDPDDVRFGKLAGERDAARARADALAEREGAARGMLERVRQAVAEAERAAKRARLAELDEQLREADAALTREVVEFYQRLLGRIREVRKLAAAANELGPSADVTRGSRWAAASANRAAWRWAQGVLPEDGAEVSR